MSARLSTEIAHDNSSDYDAAFAFRQIDSLNAGPARGAARLGSAVGPLASRPRAEPRTSGAVPVMTPTMYQNSRTAPTEPYA